ncbi:hypothetical protein ACFL96_06780 [Thermoproteota archaeon]
MESSNESKEQNKPEKKFRAGAICATVWNNSGVNQSGEIREYKTISFERSYKDKQGDWQKTHHLRTGDIPRAILVLHKAYEHIALTNPEAQESA